MGKLKLNIIALSVLFVVVTTLSITYAQDPPTYPPCPDLIVGRSIEHRLYENGDQITRFGFNLKNKSTGEWILEDIVNHSTVELKYLDQNGYEIPVNTSNFRFGTPWFEMQRYYGDINRWKTIISFHQRSNYGMWIDDPLQEGYYVVHFEDICGNKYSADRYIGPFVDLPIIRGSSIKYDFDQYGSFHCTWELPVEIFYLPPDVDIDIRVRINLFQNNTQTGWIYHDLPVHMGRTFIHYDVIDYLKNNFDEYNIAIQVTSIPSYYRTFSNPVKLKFKK